MSKTLTETVTHTIDTIGRQLDLIAERAPGNFLDKVPVVRSLTAHKKRLEKALASVEQHEAAPADNARQIIADARAAIRLGNYDLAHAKLGQLLGAEISDAELAARVDSALLSAAQPEPPVADERQCTCGMTMGHTRTCAAFDESMMRADPLAQPVAAVADERAAFEAWYLHDMPHETYLLKRSHQHPGMYDDDSVEDAWTGWEARASLPNAADERAAEAREDHECVYENGDGICRECAELAKRPKPFGYARAIDYRITGQEPEDHELCSADAPGAFAIYRASSPNAAGAPSGATPAGYVLVPIEPTPEMCLAMREAVGAGWEDSLVWAGGVAAAPQPPAPASAPDEEAFVVKRLSESLADVYTTLIGDDKVDVDDNLNAIQRVERAAQVLRLELELYRAQASAPVVLTDSARDVLAERRRQIEREGWTPARDDQYRDHELSCAAGCYAMYTLAYPAGDPPPAWPWAADWWKPTTHRRNLVKAGALILAEIERLDRSAARPQGSQS